MYEVIIDDEFMWTINHPADVCALLGWVRHNKPIFYCYDEETEGSFNLYLHEFPANICVDDFVNDLNHWLPIATMMACKKAGTEIKGFAINGKEYPLE